MAAPRGRGLRPGGVVRALGRLVVLVAVGFGLGLLFGVVTEEPELLAGHLSGESRSVSVEETEAEPGWAGQATTGSTAEPEALESGSAARIAAQAAPAATPGARPVPATSESRADDTLPRVAASPRDREEREPTSTRTPTPAAVPVAEPVMAPESAMARAEAGWSIQVGAFSDEAAAERLAEGLGGKYPVAVLPASTAGGRWRVRVQPIRSEARAREMAEELKRNERLPTWVTPMEARSGR